MLEDAKISDLYITHDGMVFLIIRNEKEELVPAWLTRYSHIDNPTDFDIGISICSITSVANKPRRIGNLKEALFSVEREIQKQEGV